MSRTNLLRLLFRGHVVVPRELNGSDDECEATPDRSALDEWLAKFERRTYVTFVSRARASKRLETRGILWMIALSVASAATLCASIFSLTTSSRPVSDTDLAASLFALATLVLSLIVSSLNFQGRSRDLFHSFRAIQRVSTRIESLREVAKTSESLENDRLALEMGYQDALDQSENHTTLDYHRARPARTGEHKKADDRARRIALLAQGSLTFIPVLIIGASLIWLLNIFASR